MLFVSILLLSKTLLSLDLLGKGVERFNGFDMHKFFVYLVSLGHFCVDLAPGALPAILPFFVLHNGLSYTEVAGLMFASSFLSSLVQPLFGYWADKSSQHWFMAFGIALSGIGLGISGFSGNYWLIFLAITLMGLGSALFHPEAARVVNRTSGNHRATGMGIFSVGGNAGFGVGPLIAAAALTAWGNPGTAVFAVFGVVMAAVMLWIVPKMFAEIESKKATPTTPNVKEMPEGKNDWGAFGRLSIVILCRSVASTSILAFLPLYCIHRFGVPEAVTSTLLAFLSIVGIFMTLAGGWLTDRVGLIRACRWGYIFMAPAFAMLIFAPSLWWFYPIVAVISFTLNGTYAAYVVLGQSYLSKNIGFASGVTLGLSSSLGGIFTPLLGMVGDAYGLDLVMWVLVGIGVLCALGSFILPEPARELDVPRK